MQAYMDNAATTQPGEAAKAAMLSAFELYGNPSSLHRRGQEAAAALERARERAARALGAEPGEIYFTSGGSEADNQAIFSCAALGAKKNKKQIISTQIEHHAVLHPLELLKKEQGFTLTLLPVGSETGMISIADLEAAITDETCLVTVMAANNEIGSIQPIEEIGAICREHKVPFHTDAVQAVGHIPVDVKTMKVDLLSLAAHKFHGPKGIGALYCRRGVALRPYIHGGAQESGRRAGTENLPGALGLAAALEEAIAEMDDISRRVTNYRDQLIHGLMQIERSHLNGDAHIRLPGNANFCFEGIEGESLLLLLDDKGIAASSGSACTSGSLEPSHVLLALRLPHEIAHGSLRLSLSRYTTRAEIDYALEVIPPVVAYLRSISPVWEKIQKEL